MGEKIFFFFLIVVGGEEERGRFEEGGGGGVCVWGGGGEEGGFEKGIKEGLSLGGNQMIYSLVEDKSISIEKGAQKLGISAEKLRANMINAGYKCPDME